MNLEWYRGKRVFLTGHTGFKGSWMCRLLLYLGANVTGYSLAPSAPLFDQLDISSHINSIYGDIRDASALQKAFAEARPEVVIHMAAQPLVRQSYDDPAYTYEVNVMGTVNLLECVRQSTTVKSVLNVTTDKVYQNNEWVYGYRETDVLNGHDPYSNSKSCAELVSRTYRDCFFQGKIPLSTARAGNVIGGGDRAVDRIVPDCVRAALAKETITLRNPNSVRPYQHVLEPLYAYLLLCSMQADNPSLAASYNIGPADSDCITTAHLAEYFCKFWKDGLSYTSSIPVSSAPHEAGLLHLDTRLARSVLSWRPRFSSEIAVKETVAWEKALMNGEDIVAFSDMQIRNYLHAE